MAITTRLELRQGQQLVMTPQLQQAIRLLQLSNMELMQYVDGELERNPLLEREDREPEAFNGNEQDYGANDCSSAEPGTDQALSLDRSAPDAAATFDTDVANIYPDASPLDLGAGQISQLSNWKTTGSGSSSFADDDGNFEAYASELPSLKDHLTAQLQVAFPEGAERLIGLHLVDLLDESGYLQADIGTIADKLGAPAPLMTTVLTRLQGFEPTGVFARDLSECLMLQLKEQNRFDPVIAKLLENLHLLANHNVAALRRAVGVDADELSEMIAEIKQLNPKPGLQYGATHVQAVVPDVFVRAATSGSWIIELNSDTLPRVLVNRSYYTMVSKSARNDHDKTYLHECLQTANWLVKSLDQRARTILRVAEEIVRQQDGFLSYGVQHLRPLNLKTVADAIQMHESTVSRVTSNKYLATPRGVFELKYFFTSAIAAADGTGESHSSESVRHRIRQMIDGETADTVLSDDMIVDRLKTDGIDIARRTVAKYREAMHIPSSVLRRRERQMEARLSRAS